MLEAGCRSVASARDEPDEGQGPPRRGLKPRSYNAHHPIPKDPDRLNVACGRRNTPWKAGGVAGLEPGGLNSGLLRNILLGENLA